jgi:hypothetical protein
LDPEHPPAVDETWVAGERVFTASDESSTATVS